MTAVKSRGCLEVERLPTSKSYSYVHSSTMSTGKSEKELERIQPKHRKSFFSNVRQLAVTNQFHTANKSIDLKSVVTEKRWEGDFEMGLK